MGESGAVGNETGWRHRAHTPIDQFVQSGQRRAVGCRSRTAVAHSESLAGVSLDRSSQRRMLLALSGNHSVAMMRRRARKESPQEAFLDPDQGYDHVTGDRSRVHVLYEVKLWRCRPVPPEPLGLKQKGNLGVGCDADVVIYEEDDGRGQDVWASSIKAIKAGEVVIRRFRRYSRSASRARTSCQTARRTWHR